MDTEISTSDRHLKVVMLAMVDATAANACTTHLDGVASAFARCGALIALMAPRPVGLSPPPIQFSRRGYDLRLFDYGAGAGLPRALGPITAFRTLYRATRNADLVYIRASALTGVFVSVLKLLRPNAVVITEHNGWLRDELIAQKRVRRFAWLFEWLQVMEASQSTRVRCVTAGIARLFADRGVDPGRLVVIGNGTDLERFHPLPRDQALAAVGLDPSAFYLGFIGSLAPWHGLQTGIAALPAILRARPNAHLLIAGDGAEAARLKKMVNKLGLEGAVTFLGEVDVDQANTVVNAFDIALAPFNAGRNARIGLSPLKIRDYAAAGRAIVSTTIEGVADPRGGDWIQLTAPDDPAAFAAGVLALMDDDDRRSAVGRAARRHAEACFGWDALAAEILAAAGLRTR